MYTEHFNIHNTRYRDLDVKWLLLCTIWGIHSSAKSDPKNQKLKITSIPWAWISMQKWLGYGMYMYLHQPKIYNFEIMFFEILMWPPPLTSQNVSKCMYHITWVFWGNYSKHTFYSMFINNASTEQLCLV